MNREEILQQAEEAYTFLCEENVKLYNNMVHSIIAEREESQSDSLGDCINLYIDAAEDFKEYLNEQNEPMSIDSSEIVFEKHIQSLESLSHSIAAISYVLSRGMITIEEWHKSENLINTIDQIVPALKHACTLESFVFSKEPKQVEEDQDLAGVTFFSPEEESVGN
ncbi:MAG: hypothetical protein DGJ47_000797 [Rickettsiaceae bacterium]